LKNERLVDAIINEDFDATIETLICADIHNVDERHRTTPLFIACQIGSLETVKLLLSLGADVNARGYSGFTGDDVTPLIDAAYFNNYDVVKTLLENGADVNAQDEYGWTPLRYSFIEKEKDDVNLKVTELLLKQPNINLNLLELAPEDLDKPGKTALDWARELGWTEVAKLIQNHINHKNLRDARLVTVKGKKEDGTPLLSRAHRDVATLVAPIIGGKRKTRKSKKSKKSKRKTRK
jgi:ankyrin repeat protein